MRHPLFRFHFRSKTCRLDIARQMLPPSWTRPQLATGDADAPSPIPGKPPGTQKNPHREHTLSKKHPQSTHTPHKRCHRAPRHRTRKDRGALNLAPEGTREAIRALTQPQKHTKNTTKHTKFPKTAHATGSPPEIANQLTSRSNAPGKPSAHSPAHNTCTQSRLQGRRSKTDTILAQQLLSLSQDRAPTLLALDRARKIGRTPPNLTQTTYPFFPFHKHS